MKVTLLELDRLPVYGEKKRNGSREKLGKVVDVVFDPKTNAAVGYLVARPAFALFFHRKDAILAFDRATVLVDKIHVDGKQAWDKAADTVSDAAAKVADAVPPVKNPFPEV